MRLRVAGSSPAFPNPGVACSGYVVEEGDTRILLDCGHGVGASLRTMLDPRDLSAILITHMHPDHFFDLLPLGYFYQLAFPAPSPIPLWLPPDGHSILCALGEAVGLPADFFEGWCEVREYDPGRSLSLGDIEVTFAPTRHFIEGFAMRFEADRIFVFSSDTAETRPVIDLAHKAALALIESTVIQYPESLDPGSANGHLDAGGAGRVARAAEVERLVITHYPQHLGSAIRATAERAFGGPTELAVPGKTYSV